MPRKDAYKRRKCNNKNKTMNINKNLVRLEVMVNLMQNLCNIFF